MMMVMVTAINGCAEQPKKIEYVYVSVPLNKPEKPPFPKVKGTDLACLSDDTKSLLLKRDEVIKSYMYSLEATIDATKLFKDH